MSDFNEYFGFRRQFIGILVVHLQAFLIYINNDTSLCLCLILKEAAEKIFIF